MKKKLTEFEVRERLLSSSVDIIELVHILATGKDPLGILDSLDFVPSERMMIMMYREISSIVKTAVPRLNMKERYKDKSTKDQAESIIQDVYNGEIDLRFGKELLEMLSLRVHTIEMIRLNEQLEIASKAAPEGALVVNITDSDWSRFKTH